MGKNRHLNTHSNLRRRYRSFSSRQFSFYKAPFAVQIKYPVLVLFGAVALGHRHIWRHVAASIQRYCSMDRAVWLVCRESLLLNCPAKCPKRNQFTINSILSTLGARIMKHFYTTYLSFRPILYTTCFLGF